MLELTQAEVNQRYSGCKRNEKVAESKNTTGTHRTVNLDESKIITGRIAACKSEIGRLEKKLASPGVRGMDTEESETETKVRNWLKLGLSPQEAREVANLPESAMREAALNLGLSQNEAQAFAWLCHMEGNEQVQEIIEEAALGKKFRALRR